MLLGRSGGGVILGGIGRGSWWLGWLPCGGITNGIWLGCLGKLSGPGSLWRCSARRSMPAWEFRWEGIFSAGVILNASGPRFTCVAGTN